MFYLRFVQKKSKHLDFFIRQKKTLISCLISIEDLFVEPIHWSVRSEREREHAKRK
jgi:hypothetical protein